MEDRTILYVEDNYHNRRIVRKILATRGYNVVEAEDGLVGYEMICEMKPPLVLLDIALPHLDGIQIVQRLKADKETRHIPVVALTASAMRGDRERFLEAGCDDYLSKPVRAYELIEMVERYYEPIDRTDQPLLEKPSGSEEQKELEKEMVGGHRDIFENGVMDGTGTPSPDASVDAAAADVEAPLLEKATSGEAAAKKDITSAVKEPPTAKGKKTPDSGRKAVESKTKAAKPAAKKAAAGKNRERSAGKRAPAKKKTVKRAAEKVPAVAAAGEMQFDSAIERHIADMLSSVVIQPPSPDVVDVRAGQADRVLTENVAEMFAEIPPQPHTPDGVSEAAAPAPSVEAAPAAPAPEPAAAQKEAEPAVQASPAASPPRKGDDLWVIDPDPTDSRLMRRLLAAKLKVQTVEVSPHDLTSLPEKRPALLLFGARHFGEALQNAIQMVRGVEGLADIPYAVLVKQDPGQELIARFAPDAELVWLKEELVNPSFLDRLAALMAPKEAPPRAPAAEHEQAASTDRARASVLVIEDVSDSAALAEKILTNNNYTALVAGSGEQGMHLAKEKHPDLILLDLGLPDVDGQTLIGILRADPHLKDTPVILCTAWPKDTLEKMVDAYGFDGYISKPYKVAEFMQVVEAHLV